MKPDWDKLGSAYAESSCVVIADVDCTTADGGAVCIANKVDRYPVVKYFTADTGKEGAEFNGGKDFASLDRFVKGSLAKKCMLDMK